MKQSKSKQTEHTSVPSPPRVNNIPRRVVMVRYAWHVSLAYRAWREWACWAGFSINGQYAFAGSQGLVIVCVPMLILCKQPLKKSWTLPRTSWGAWSSMGRMQKSSPPPAAMSLPDFGFKFWFFWISKAEQLHHWILGIRQTLNSLFRLQPAIFF